MTEKSLLLKCDVAHHLFIVGTDFPAARVFDATTSSLAAVVELPPRSRTISLAALTLTSVAIQRVEDEAEEAEKKKARKTGKTAAVVAEQLLDDNVATYYAAVGLSNGTLLLHDVRRDMLIAHVQVSEMQQPLTSLQLCGGFAFCLAANSTIYVVSLRDAAAGPCLRLRVQPDASSIAVAKVLDDGGASPAYRVMVAGPTNALYEVRTLTTGGSATVQATPQVHATKLLVFPSQGTTAEFAWVSNTPAHTAGSVASLPAITASAQDGVVRVWDLQYDSAAPSPASLLGTAGSTALTARWRRTLLCGQRILNVSVLPSTGGPASHRRHNYVMVTTLTGSVLLWSLGDALLPPVVEPTPLKPDVVLVSAVPSGRLLVGTLRAVQSGFGDGASSTSSSSFASTLRGLEVTLLRGRFAMPIFETKNIGAAVEASNASTRASTRANEARRAALATLALGVAGNTAITVVELPLSSTSATTLAERRDVEYLLESTTDAATSSFVVMDTVWAAHQQQVAAKASQSMSEAFKAPQLFHAKSIQDLPVKQMTLEQRLQQVAREEAAAARKRKNLALRGTNAETGEAEEDDDEEGEEKAGRSVLSQHALGLATIPLYQALHANDTSAVMDLLNMTSRSAEGMRATVLSLQLPYCLQLLQVIAERLGLVSKAVEKTATAAAATNSTGVALDASAQDEESRPENLQDVKDVDGQPKTTPTAKAETAPNASAEGVLRGGVAAFSIRSSLLEWIDAIVNFRGSELLAVQREWNARAARRAAGTSTPEDDVADAVSPPKDFLAPIMHHYQELCAQYDKLAVLYGRLSIFKAVRPSQKNAFTNIPRQSLGSNVEMARPTRTHPESPLATSTGGDAHRRRLHLAEKSSVVDSDIIFPVMFKESRARSGHRVVRVRSKLEIAKKRQQRENKDAALQKRARALAKQALHQASGRSILDDNDDHRHGGIDVMDQIMAEEMGRGDGELDLDALEAMDLGGESDLDHSDAELSEEGVEVEEEEGSHRRRSKKTRGDVVDEMIPDAGGDDEKGGNDDDDEEDFDAGLDSSEAEFSSASDDEVRSDVLSEGSEEEEEEEEGDEEREEGDSADDGDLQYADGGSDGNDDADEDDGMGADMQELLTRHEDDEDRTERRKAKKVRTDQ
jgi:hypothetical protein